MPTPASPAPATPAAAPSTATVTSSPAPGPQSNILDTILVVGVLLITSGVIAALIFVKIDQGQLAILAGLASTMIGSVIGGYTGYRWGASDALKKLTATTTTPSA